MTKRRIKRKWTPWTPNPRGVYRAIKKRFKQSDREWTYYEKYHILTGHLKTMEKKLKILNNLFNDECNNNTRY